MQSDSGQTESNRPLTEAERNLARWMLQHGLPEAEEFLSQLDEAEATSWRCPCGCASVNFRIKGHRPAPPGVHILGDFVFGTDHDLNGVFIFEQAGILSGIEVYGGTGDAPKSLPSPGLLRPL
jgi:hypothetical protein